MNERGLDLLLASNRRDVDLTAWFDGAFLLASRFEMGVVGEN